MTGNRSAAPAIKFGTSGWRAINADQFTFANVRLATAAIAVNCIPAMFEVNPGLRTSRDMPMCFFPGPATQKARA